MTLSATIVVPSRYAAKRLPAKPLVPIAGVPLMERVWRIAAAAAKTVPGTQALLAVDDERLMTFAKEKAIDAVMTDPACPSGTDRVLAALDARGLTPEVVLNLQGDNPTCPVAVVTTMLGEFVKRSDIAVATPVVRLSWDALDRLREKKKTTPFSGTFAVFVPEPEAAEPSRADGDATTPPRLDRGRALYFSKKEIPLLRNEAGERERSPVWSPLYRHIGLYAYRLGALRRFAASPMGQFERLEQLEQLRFLELGIPVWAVEVDLRGRTEMTGVDSPEDVQRTESFFREHPELML